MELTLDVVVEALTAPVEPCRVCKGSRLPTTDEDLMMGCCLACGGTGLVRGRELTLIEQQARRWLRELAWAVVEGRGR